MGETQDVRELSNKLRSLQRRFGPDGLQVLQAVTDLGGALNADGRGDEAVDLLSEGFGRAKRVAPGADQPTWLAGHELAVVLAATGRVERAVDVGWEVVRARRHLLGPDAAGTVRTSDTSCSTS